MSSYLRIFAALVIFALFDFAVSTQQTVAPAQTTSGQVTVSTAQDGAAQFLTVGQPYSAVIEHDSTQALADGTHITRPKTITKECSDSQGRMRREFYFPEDGDNAGKLMSVMIEDRMAGMTTS